MPRAGDHVLEQNRMREMYIPDGAVNAIRRTWEQEPPALYGRMDLAFDGKP